jgi:putative PIN family toxin of toxin-antitoxin system
VIRVVVDTSVLIRYLIKPSAAITELIELWWLNDKIQVVSGPELLTELESVLRRDYIRELVRPAEGQVLLDVIAVKAEILASLGPIPSYTRDPKDDKFIACALAGSTGYIVTVDQDLLVLGSFGGVRMVTPGAFVALLRDIGS